LNLIFVFLFCVGKMTHQDFKSDKGKEASFYQRYPVVCWTDFIIFAMMLLLMWMDYINYNHADSWIKQLVEINPTLISILGFVIIGVVIFITAKWLINKTKQRDGDEDTY
jgi:large-conductance mechanosensitive channel